MNEGAMLHIPDSQYCFAVGDKELVIRLRMAKEDADAAVALIYGQKYEFHEKRTIQPLTICYSDRLYNYYEIRLCLADVRLAYIFQIEAAGKIHYYCEEGLLDSYNFDEGFYNFFQMPYINRNDVMPMVDWMKDAVFYQIFVDRFRIGDTKKDMSYVNMKWGELPTPKSFAGGDLRGITEKIDYIAGLGITAIYLTPIFRSISNHKYDTIDYMEIDPQFGTNEDFRKLVNAAHARGIRVVLDAVFNHCSKYLTQFDDVKKHGRQSPYYDWFVIDGDFPEEETANYECFAACAYMPKLNTANTNVQEFLLSVARYWIREYGIDGWRLDVSDEVSHEFWRMFRRAVKEEKQDAVIIGENWHDAYPYLRGDQYDSIMNYAFTKACLDYFSRETLDAKQMAERLSANLMRNTHTVNDMMLNLLDSHDTHRFYSEVGENKNRLLAGVALETVFPGAPCIYYGTEICTPGGYDPDSRRCFDWDETHWDETVFLKIRELLHLRGQAGLIEGSVRIWAEDELLAVERTNGGQSVQLFINMTDRAKRLEISDGAQTGQFPVADAAECEILTKNRAAQMEAAILIEPEGYVILRRTPERKMEKGKQKDADNKTEHAKKNAQTADMGAKEVEA